MNSKRISISYYALLRQERGSSLDEIQTSASTLKELYLELKKKHSFSLTEQQVRAAVNGQVSPWDHPIKDGDRILLIPPVAGG